MTQNGYNSLKEKQSINSTVALSSASSTSSRTKQIKINFFSILNLSKTISNDFRLDIRRPIEDVECLKSISK